MTYNQVRQQYRDDGNLNARIHLHARYSTNTYPWFRWVFDHLHLPAAARVLELGCGPGDLWRENRERVPAGWRVTLTDTSPGMLAAARRQVERPVSLSVADAQALPCSGARFDAVLAHHMLYHVPHRERALAEVRRVLKPGGAFYAATNGQRHMLAMWSLLTPFVPDVLERVQRVGCGFTLENGAAQLAPWFEDVALYRYENDLAITDAGAVLAYVRSSNALMDAELSADQWAALAATIDARIAAQGALHVPKATGLFVAT
jgi:SAM-dependent methyltransferase